MSDKKKIEEIDKIVDDVLADPAKAKTLKDRLHKALPEDAAADADISNDEDLWDNVPV